MAVVYAFECAFCGSKISEGELVLLGCCPLCKDCYGRLRRK
ncbi:TPA_asm: hypothetical protein GahPV1_gp10 [Geoglobus ahangari pleomorphic virus 1]|uniref:Uncharacterized protein n=1 Tax=Geoglobus ahangari pleomorphic virus 1 TaxID=3115752 RepID=A0AAT9J7S2_9VIRU|nr:hypothetical protein [Geoglobus ahangari]